MFSIYGSEEEGRENKKDQNPKYFDQTGTTLVSSNLNGTGHRESSPSQSSPLRHCCSRADHFLQKFSISSVTIVRRSSLSLPSQKVTRFRSRELLLQSVQTIALDPLHEATVKENLSNGFKFSCERRKLVFGRQENEETRANFSFSFFYFYFYLSFFIVKGFKG
ncbi:hypothetical protein FEM48_Zijuj07G0148500 [Ziziphus jujuba var. spinosa]|uniref:Uncharacterized protein n=1 Tax=Ziziphus jujuba var. spinosa TaxID=714518 RepID=A0A978V599_ZIZJJ|nr:hypothetical protein FEM48_Zijuj07G0148500 [Ziziphus jujuba var. spinosa]